MLFSEATKYIEAFLDNSLEAPQEQFPEAVNVWALVTSEFVSKIGVDTPARLVMNHNRLFKYEQLATGIIGMATMVDNSHSVVGAALFQRLSEETIDGLHAFNHEIGKMQLHIKNQIDLAWKNL